MGPRNIPSVPQQPQFGTLDFFTERQSIQANMTQALAARFAAMGGFFDLKFFQLRQISLPKKFEDAILQKILFLQEQKAAANTQMVEVERAKSRKAVRRR